MLDQGGGSTEISLFEKQQLIFSNSFNIGTTILKDKFLNQFKTSIQDSLDEVDRFSIDFINKEFQFVPNQINKNIDYFVGVGRSVTIVTVEKSNENQHDFKLTKNAITQVIDNLCRELCAYKTMYSLQIGAKK
jgi:exopolyphosphatase/pppGpp-phosphohydrolase